MKQIEILGFPKKQTNYLEIECKFYIPVPVSFANVNSKNEVAKAYSPNYGVETINNTEFFTVTRVFPFDLDKTNDEIKESLISQYNISAWKLSRFQLDDFALLTNLIYNGTDWE